MHYLIEGRNCELLRVELDSGEAVIAEVGKMVYIRGNISRSFNSRSANGTGSIPGGSSSSPVHIAGTRANVDRN